MTDHLPAIKATIPTGDPSSPERMEWCKAAAVAIAETCLEHVKKVHGAKTPFHEVVFDARMGIQSFAGHADSHLLKKARQ